MNTRDEIKTWLKTSGHTRAWLAGELMVTLNTVNCWLSNREIPDAKLARIRELMGVAEQKNTEQIDTDTARAARDAGLIRSVSITFVADEYELVADAARDAGKSIEEYLLDTALKHAAEPAAAHCETSTTAAG